MEDKTKLTRTFICLKFNDEVIKEIARLQEEINKIKFTGKTTELENIHLTLKFLGEIDGKKLNEIQEKLKDIKFSEFEAKLGKIGIFSIRKSPRITWIKIEGKELWELQNKIDKTLKEIISPEERFMSHLTIARIKYTNNKNGLIEYIKRLGIKEIKFKINKFYLMSSELKSPAPIYRIIKEYPCNDKVN